MRFTLQEILWDSEFGVNYLALEKGQESSVVVRKLSTELDHRQQERWKREWQILQKMRHRGIPQMIEMTTYEFEGRRYPILIHEYAKGEQLRRRHDNRPLSQTQSMLICGDLLKIVSHLQTVNPAVIHRNISPDSIYLLQDTDRVQLWDFGAAMFFSEHLDTVTQNIGELVFAAPEQLLGTPDLSSDVYSIAMTLIWCLSTPEQRPKIDWGSIALRIPSLPVSDLLRTWLKKATAPAEHRFATANEAYEAFKGFLPDEPTLENLVNLKDAFDFTSAIQDAAAGNLILLEQWYERVRSTQMGDPKVSMAAVALRKVVLSPATQNEIINWILGLDGIKRYWLKLQSHRLQSLRMAAEIKSLGGTENALPIWARLIGVKQRQIQSQRDSTVAQKEAIEIKCVELENLLYLRILPYAKCFGIPVHEVIKGV